MVLTAALKVQSLGRSTAKYQGEFSVFTETSLESGNQQKTRVPGRFPVAQSEKQLFCVA